MSRGDDDADMHLLSGRAHPEIAAEIAGYLGKKIGDVRIETQPSGEFSVQLNESVRGKDVFVIQTLGEQIHESIFEQLLMIDAAKRGSAKSITAVCPLLLYSRQDRKAGGREPISARLVVDMLSEAGADRIMCVDLHSGQTQGFFDGPFDHLIAMPLFKQYIKDNIGTDVVFVSPDAGRAKITERYASAFRADMAIIHKYRPTTKKNIVEAKYLIGDVKGRTCVIIDDLIDTAGTFVAAAELLKEKGAGDVWGLATHGVLSGVAPDRIKDSAYKKVVVTNTVPVDSSSYGGKLEVLSVSKLIADAINAVAKGESVSALFEGQNQI
jgi:ribose-phosphate pyrophosphokinase